MKPPFDNLLARRERRRKRNRTPAEVERDRAEHAFRHGRDGLFGASLLAALTVAAWLVVIAIAVVFVAAVAGDAPARVRQPVGFDTISEEA